MILVKIESLQLRGKVNPYSFYSKFFKDTVYVFTELKVFYNFTELVLSVVSHSQIHSFSEYFCVGLTISTILIPYLDVVENELIIFLSLTSDFIFHTFAFS